MRGLNRVKPVLAYTYVDQEEPPSLVCNICHSIIRTHCACPSCNNAYCRECVRKWVSAQQQQQQQDGAASTCPCCRRSLRMSKLRHDPELQRQLDALLVSCPNSAPLEAQAIGELLGGEQRMDQSMFESTSVMCLVPCKGCSCHPWVGSLHESCDLKGIGCAWLFHRGPA